MIMFCFCASKPLNFEYVPLRLMKFTKNAQIPYALKLHRLTNAIQFAHKIS